MLKQKPIYVVIFHFFLFFYIDLASAQGEQRSVYVYKDEGVSTALVLQTVQMLKRNLPHYNVHEIDAKGVIQNSWARDARLFIMPGGADLPYAKKLNGTGNKNIKNFVKDGGAYLGLCAGAYYASTYIEFDKGGKLEVIGNRELAFFPGKSIGPILAEYSYNSNSGSRAAQITLENDTEVNLYYNGGGFFEDAKKYPNVSVIGNYNVNKKTLPAIIYVTYGKGRVVLSGVHFEFDPFLFTDSDPYLNAILSSLKNAEIERNLLINSIFETLGLFRN